MADSEPRRDPVKAAKEFLERRYGSSASLDRQLYSRWYQSKAAYDLRLEGKATPKDFFFYFKYRDHFPWVTTSLLTYKMLVQQG